MGKIQEIAVCLNNFPKLEAKKIGLFYSGGLDSQTVAAALLNMGYDITLITIDNGAQTNKDIANTAVNYLAALKTPGKITNHAHLSAQALYRDIAIRKLPEDIKKYGVDYSCLGCKISMLAVAIVYAKEQGIDALLDGFVKAQAFYPEQTNAYINFVDSMCSDYGIEHHSPLYALNDKEKVKFLAVTLGVPTRSLDCNCLFEERAMEVNEADVSDYLQRKKEDVESYIAMHSNLGIRPEIVKQRGRTISPSQPK